MEKKFYLIEVATGDIKIEGKGMYEYATLNEAEANFHSKLGTAMKSDLYETDLIFVVDQDGKPVKGLSKHYIAATEQSA